MEQVVADLQQRVAELTARLANEQQEQMERMMKVLEKYAEQKEKDKPRLVDTRGLGKPAQFGTGGDKELERTFPNYVAEDVSELCGLCLPGHEGAVGMGRGE